MFNLIQKQQRNELRKEYHIRLAIVALGFVIVGAVIACALAFPSHIFSIFREKDLQEKVDALGNSNILKEGPALTELLKSTNERVRALYSNKVETPLYSVVDVITANAGANIRLTGFSYDTGKINVQGIASDRDSLISFSNRVGAKDMFDQVDVPISNFTKDKDITFSMSVILKK